MQGHNVQVVRGDPQSGQFSVWYFKEGELLAVDAINRPGDFMTAKRWIGERKHPDPVKVADVAQDLKTL
jgi:3-phenylpropionate/trans-cinnamate dioxygenase ferredoxin reductase subunit